MNLIRKRRKKKDTPFTAIMNESPSQRPPLRRQPQRSRPRRFFLAGASATTGVIQLLSLCAAVARGADTSGTAAASAPAPALKGGGRHSPSTWKPAATATAAATTIRVQCPAAVVRGIHNHNTPGGPVPLRETRGCWTTLLRGGSSAPDKNSEGGTTRDRPWGLHRSLPRRGGAWFTGYSDTTEEEDASEEETTEGGDTFFSEERSDGVIAEGGEGGRDTSRREWSGGAGSDEKGLHGVEGIPTNEFNSPVVAWSFEKKR